MLRLDYTLSSSWSGSGERALADAEEWQLRYDYFLGDVTFIVYEVDLSARWGWVPVLDFALGLDAVVGALVDGGADMRFEFTESDATIAFRRVGDGVNIVASYTPDRARASYDDLRVAARRFLARIVGDLVRVHPELARNSFIKSVLQTISSSE